MREATIKIEHGALNERYRLTGIEDEWGEPTIIYISSNPRVEQELEVIIFENDEGKVLDYNVYLNVEGFHTCGFYGIKKIEKLKMDEGGKTFETTEIRL